MTITDYYEDQSQRKAGGKLQASAHIDNRLLFVDDDPTILEGYRFIFEDEGYAVDVALNQSELMICLELYDYDAIILDYNLGKSNGVEIAKQINDVKPGVRIIFISGQKNAEEELIRNDIRIDGFFEKPLQAETLLEYISSYLMDQ